MATVNLYNAIYQLLSTDDVILNYLQIDPTDPDRLIKSAKRIQRRQKPVDPISNLPLITFYNGPGRRDSRNGEVYYAPFLFDVYTKDDVSLALGIQERIFQLLEGTIPVAMNQVTFLTRFLDGFETQTDLLNTYCYTQVFELSASLDLEDRV